MPKTKAGTLKPQIDQLRKEIREKGDALAGEERRREMHRLKRLQRKVRRIRKLETARTTAEAPEVPAGDTSEAS
ncbi:MAG: hypothetical protein PVF68_04900 [Acidobacteriota bacterium]|jgi:hypothetical protein